MHQIVALVRIKEGSKHPKALKHIAKRHKPEAFTGAGATIGALIGACIGVLSSSLNLFTSGQLPKCSNLFAWLRRSSSQERTLEGKPISLCFMTAHIQTSDGSLPPVVQEANEQEYANDAQAYTAANRSCPQPPKQVSRYPKRILTASSHKPVQKTCESYLLLANSSEREP